MNALQWRSDGLAKGGWLRLSGELFIDGGRVEVMTTSGFDVSTAGPRFRLSTGVSSRRFQRAHRFVRSAQTGRVAVDAVARPQAAGNRPLRIDPPAN